MATRAKSDAKAELRAAQRAYLTLALNRDPHKRTLSEIARAAGLNPATLTRFYNDPSYAGALDAMTIRSVAEVTGVPASSTIAGGVQAGLSEEAEPYVARAGDEAERLFRLMIGGRKQVEPWLLHTTALENAGYMPGDYVLVDMERTPKAGDPVCAQVYAADRLGAETIWRIYEPPYLVAASSDQKWRKPVLVDGERVAIRGVVTEALRLRRSAA